MSKYSQLRQLLSEDSILEKLSFYPDCLLDLRSILSDWIEAQDWSAVLCDSRKTQRSQELFQEALSLLQDKRQNADFEFYIRNFETKLKKAYQSNPVKFVEELHQCLEKEEELLNTMLSQEQAMHCDFGFQPMSAQEVSERISHCRKLDQRVLQILRAAYICLEKWQDDIVNQSTIIRDVYGTGDTMLPPFKVFTGLKKELEQTSRDTVEELKNVLMGLEGWMTQWKLWQLHECVSRKVEGEDPDLCRQVEEMCEQVCGSVYSLMKCVASKQMQGVFSVLEQNQPLPTSAIIPTPSVISSLSMGIKDILKKIVEMFLVVREQPPLTMMIEKEKGQKDKEDINNSKKFKTTVGILGGKGFEDGISILEVEIYLAFSQDLAVAMPCNKRPKDAFKIYHDRPDTRSQMRPRYGSGSAESPPLPYERTYEKLRVEQFSRKDTKHVYKQLYNVVYDVRLSFPLFMHEFTTQTISLPIIVRTGANQASEHIGAQLWHSFSSPNVYNLQADMVSSMPVSNVIQMMDERIKFIGGQGLRPHEKEFLKERLLMVGAKGNSKYANDTTITLDNFIKDKVYLPRHGSTAKDLMDFSLWRWLHSIINLLDDPENLKQPWIDGIIYGFASRQQCISALEGSQDGTFLLRFSESVLHGNHTMSKGGLAAVIQRNGQPNFAPPISSEDIEKDGLGNMIASIGCHHLLGTELTIATLCEKYPATKPPENPTCDRYFGWKKTEVIIPTDPPYPGASPNPHAATAPAQRERKKPKRPRQKLQAKEGAGAKQYRVNSPGSPDSTISSIASPGAAMSPDGRSQFQPVGVREFQPEPPLSWSEVPAPTSTIPTTVYPYMMDANSQDRKDVVHTTQSQTMILQLPQDTQVTQMLADGVQVMGISGPQMQRAENPNPSSSYGQSPAGFNIMSAQFLLGSEDPNLSGMMPENLMLNGNGEQHPLSIEDIDECLNMNSILNMNSGVQS